MIKYFLSGAPGIKSELLGQLVSYIDYRLLSMHDAFKSNTKIWCALSHHEKSTMQEVMLDSGAFTAFTKGHKVSLEKLMATYDDTIRKLSKKIKQVWMINLDVIPGEYGRLATPEQIASALEQSNRNFKVLKKRYGDRVLPVFHQTEPFSRLQEVVKQNHFIAMGFRQDFEEMHRIQTAEQALEYAHSKGALVHGLATTGYRMLKRAPFDTVDSATWLYVAVLGQICFISESGKDLVKLNISERSPAQRDHRAHYRTLAPEEQQLIRGRLKEINVTLEQVESDVSYRILFNAHQTREWLRIYQRPAVVAEKGLFPI